MAAQYTLILGTRNWSSWSLRPYLAMRATGAAFEEIVIALRQPETQSGNPEAFAGRQGAGAQDRRGRRDD